MWKRSLHMGSGSIGLSGTANGCCVRCPCPCTPHHRRRVRPNPWRWTCVHQRLRLRYGDWRRVPAAADPVPS